MWAPWVIDQDDLSLAGRRDCRRGPCLDRNKSDRSLDGAVEPWGDAVHLTFRHRCLRAQAMSDCLRLRLLKASAVGM